MRSAFSKRATADGTRFLEMVFPEQSNHYGTLFGGTALSLMGKAAFITASRRARPAVVMVAGDRVEFRLPVRVGKLVELDARIVRTRRRSMTVEVAVVAETLLTCERELAMPERFEMLQSTCLDARRRWMGMPPTSDSTTTSLTKV
jgi:acyl-CoA hydrolase